MGEKFIFTPNLFIINDLERKLKKRAVKECDLALAKTYHESVMLKTK
jgi:hypothetical protein